MFSCRKAARPIQSPVSAARLRLRLRLRFRLWLCSAAAASVSELLSRATRLRAPRLNSAQLSSAQRRSLRVSLAQLSPAQPSRTQQKLHQIDPTVTSQLPHSYLTVTSQLPHSYHMRNLGREAELHVGKIKTYDLLICSFSKSRFCLPSNVSHLVTVW